MEEESSALSSRSPKKPLKKARVSAVEKEKKRYKKSKKKNAVPMDVCSDDDFEKPGPSRRPQAANVSKPTPDELRRQKVRENTAKWRAKKSAEEKKQELAVNAQRNAATRANETPAERARRNQLDAERHATA